MLLAYHFNSAFISVVAGAWAYRKWTDDLC